MRGETDLHKYFFPFSYRCIVPSKLSLATLAHRLLRSPDSPCKVAGTHAAASGQNQLC